MKKTMHDMVPQDNNNKSIRNIPIPDRTQRSKFASKKNTSKNQVAAHGVESLVSTSQQNTDVKPVPRSAVAGVKTHDKDKEDVMSEDGFIIDARRLDVNDLRSDNDFKAESLNNFVVTGHAKKRQNGKRKFGILVSAFVIFCIIFSAFAFSGIFASAEISVVQRSNDKEFSNNLLTLSYGNPGDIVDVVTIEKVIGTRVVATDEEYVESKASGQIVIFNDYSSASQKLIKNTRFETPDGKIFRIQDSVTVPGLKKEGGETIPGSIEVTVYADESGESFNIETTDFTIPGFKSDQDRYRDFYARSKTNMTGGFAGIIKKVTEEDLLAAQNTLSESLEEQLFDEVAQHIPESYIYLNHLAQIRHEDAPQSDADQDSVQINIKGFITIPIFESNAFEEFLAESLGESVISNSNPYVSNVSDLDISYEQDPAFVEMGELHLLVSGSADVLWRIDTAELKSDLLGKNNEEVQEVLKQYLTIDAAKDSIKPFWRNSYPNDVNNIEIKFVDSI